MFFVVKKRLFLAKIDKESPKCTEGVGAYLIFVIFFTLAKFLENKIYTKKRPFFVLKSVKNATFGVKYVENAIFSR